jgi:site-specific DNA recombinase
VWSARSEGTLADASGGLFQCAHCGRAITGEKIRRKLRSGGVREHNYYKCANNYPGPDHPKVRWREHELEIAIIKELSKLQFPTPELVSWFRNLLTAGLDEIASAKHRQMTVLTKRKSELTSMQDRLLNSYLAGTVKEEVYLAKLA